MEKGNEIISVSMILESLMISKKYFKDVLKPGCQLEIETKRAFSYPDDIPTGRYTPSRPFNFDLVQDKTLAHVVIIFFFTQIYLVGPKLALDSKSALLHGCDDISLVLHALHFRSYYWPWLHKTP